MLTTALVVLLRSIGLICGGHRAIVLENLALSRSVNRRQNSTASSHEILSTGKLPPLKFAGSALKSRFTLGQPATTCHCAWVTSHLPIANAGTVT